MLKVVSIDFDGTIADTLPLCIEAFRQALKPVHNRLLSDAEITKDFGVDEEGIARRLGGNSWAQVVEDYTYFYEKLHCDYTSVIDGIDELLRKVKASNIPLALITGKAKRTADISLKKLGIYDMFDAFEYGSPIKCRKAEAMANLMTQFKIKPEELVYIGDSPADVFESRENSVLCLSAAYAPTAEIETLKKINPDNICYSVKELSDRLFGLISRGK